MRDMTVDDWMRLKGHPNANRLFKKLLGGTSDGTTHKVCYLNGREWLALRTLVELSYVDIENGRVVITFTISSLVRLEYI